MAGTGLPAQAPFPGQSNCEISPDDLEPKFQASGTSQKVGKHFYSHAGFAFARASPPGAALRFRWPVGARPGLPGSSAGSAFTPRSVTSVAPAPKIRELASGSKSPRLKCTAAVSLDPNMPKETIEKVQGRRISTGASIF